MDRNYAVSGQLLIVGLGQVRWALGISLHPYRPPTYYKPANTPCLRKMGIV